MHAQQRLEGHEERSEGDRTGQTETKQKVNSTPVWIYLTKKKRLRPLSVFFFPPVVVDLRCCRSLYCSYSRERVRVDQTRSIHPFRSFIHSFIRSMHCIHSFKSERLLSLSRQVWISPPFVARGNNEDEVLRKAAALIIISASCETACDHSHCEPRGTWRHLPRVTVT
jgi:hypothetical protein